MIKTLMVGSIDYVLHRFSLLHMNSNHRINFRYLCKSMYFLTDFHAIDETIISYFRLKGCCFLQHKYPVLLPGVKRWVPRHNTFMELIFYCASLMKASTPTTAEWDIRILSILQSRHNKVREGIFRFREIREGLVCLALNVNDHMLCT